MTHTTTPNYSYQITLDNLCCVAFAPSLLGLKRANTRLIRDTVKPVSLTIPHPTIPSQQQWVICARSVAFALSVGSRPAIQEKVVSSSLQPHSNSQMLEDFSIAWMFFSKSAKSVIILPLHSLPFLLLFRKPFRV